MKHLGWITLTVFFLVASSVISAQVAIFDLRKEREWKLERVAAPGAELDGVTVRVEATRAVTTLQRPEHALVHVRLSLQGQEDARQAWLNCRLTLHDDRGRVWFPLETGNIDGAIKAIASDGLSNNRCNPTPYDAPANDSVILSDQVFLVPANMLAQLSMHVSGYGTRPRALAMPITPVLETVN